VPSALVVVECTWPVPLFVIVTVAFGTTAPEESFKVPDNAPVEADWLKSDGLSVIEQISSANNPTTNMWPCTRLQISLNIHIPPILGFFSELKVVVI
jgi:uncharacterized membrane protein YhhN